MIAVALFGTLCLYLFYQFGFPASQPRTDSWMPQSQDELTQTGDKLVPLEAHIMSKCPDARVGLCLYTCDRQAEERADRDFGIGLSERLGPAGDAARLRQGRLHLILYWEVCGLLQIYVPLADNPDILTFAPTRPTDNDGVACKHGPAECLGNIIELCAQKLYPDPKTYLGFTMCLTRDYKEIPQRSLIEDCALEHAINFDALNECATKDDGAYGIGMLRSSVQRSSNVGHDFLGIVISI
jgi:hypothetical protein